MIGQAGQEEHAMLVGQVEQEWKKDQLDKLGHSVKINGTSIKTKGTSGRCGTCMMSETSGTFVTSWVNVVIRISGEIKTNGTCV